jgi:hypothetical protein
LVSFGVRLPAHAERNATALLKLGASEEIFHRDVVRLKLGSRIGMCRVCVWVSTGLGPLRVLDPLFAHGCRPEAGGMMIGPQSRRLGFVSVAVARAVITRQ